MVFRSGSSFSLERRLRCPGPTPRIGLPRPVSPVLAGSGRVALGPTHRKGEEFLLAVRCITCGDVNPDCHGLLGPLVSGGPVAGRRLSSCPRLVALHDFFFRKPDSVSGAFSSFAVHFRARRRPIIYPAFRRQPRKKSAVFQGFIRISTTIAPRASWAVHKPVDKLTKNISGKF